MIVLSGPALTAILGLNDERRHDCTSADYMISDCPYSVSAVDIKFVLNGVIVPTQKWHI